MRADSKQGNPRHRSGRRGYHAAQFLLFAVLAQPAVAQTDIAPFRLFDISGQLSVGYVLDEWQDNRSGIGSEVSSAVWKEQLTINTRSYVYHPAFLTMYIGGGPLFLQNSYDSNGLSDGYDDTLFSFNARFDFLNRRPYAFSTYFKRAFPEVTTGLTGRFFADTDEYGIRGTLRKPFSPLNIHWEASRRRSKGSGFGAIVDETVDRFKLRTRLPIGDEHSVGLQLDWSEHNSQSGSPGLPIQASQMSDFNAALDYARYFDHDKRVHLSQRLAYRSQETFAGFESETDSLFYRGSLHWEKSEATSFTGKMNFYDESRDSIWSRSGDLSGSFTHRRSDRLVLSGSGSFAADSAPGFASDVMRAHAEASYQRKLPIGRLSASANLSYARTDRDSTVSTVSVFDEPHVLVGTIPSELNRDFVITESVVVTNEDRTQVFGEGVDYRLFTVGAVTSIERIITGNILDGQTVLVSYDQSTGGTVEYQTFGQSLSASLALPRWARIYVRLRERDTSIVTGLPTNPLNDSRGYEAGARIDIPLASGWSFGTNYRYVRQDETISPYVGEYVTAYLRTRTVWRTSLRFGVSRSMVENEFSPEDIDMMNYSVGITSRLPGGVLLDYSANYREDLGGSVIREDWRHTLKLRWRYRLVRISLFAQSADVQQNGTGRDSTRISAQITRRFL